MILYYLPVSGPCRAVQLLASVLGLDLELKVVDLFKGEHLSSEFIKLNKHHTVPTFKDDKIVLCESRAIMAYLVNQYAQNTSNASLYPVDPVKRARVDEALYQEATSLYPALRQVVFPLIRGNQKTLNQNDADVVTEKLNLLNEDLGEKAYIAGDEMTIADLSLLATYTCVDATGFWNTEKLTNVHAWMKRLHDSGKIKNWNDVALGTAKAYGDLIKSRLNSN